MSRPAVFLDRDGTLVEEVPYRHDTELEAAEAQRAGRQKARPAPAVTERA
jgi:histidinol phosphatase-like enzyme